MTERLSKSVSDDLLTRISRVEFRPGDTLPSEQQLMAHYGVGRNTVREAMQALRALGLVEIRPRLGARVLTTRAENALASSALSALLRDTTIDDLYEVRLIMEPAAAAMAANNRSDEDLVAIKQALTHFRVAYEMGTNVWQADIEFHQAVAVASGNAVLPQLLAPMSDLLNNARKATGVIPAAAERALHEHDAIAGAIESRSARQARAAMTTHIRSAIWAIGQLKAIDPVAPAAASPGR